MSERNTISQSNFMVGSGIFVVLLLLFVTSLFGCNQENDKEADSGYVQTSLDFPKDLQDVIALNKTTSGKLWLVGARSELDGSSTSLWELNNDDSWKEVVDINSLLSLDASDVFISSPILKNDTVLSLVTNYDDPSKGLKFYLIDPELEAGYKKIEISEKAFSGEVGQESLPTMDYRLFPVTDDRVLVQVRDYGTQDQRASLFILDISNETVDFLSTDKNIEQENILSAVQADETLYVAYGGMDNHEIHIGTLDLLTGSFEDIDPTVQKELAELFEHSHTMPIITEGYDAGSVIIYSAGGVYEYNNDHTRKLLDEQDITILSNPAITTLGIVFDNEDDFFVISVGQRNSGESTPFLLHKCIKTLGARTDSEPTSTLRVWSLEESATLRQGIALFRDEHPSVEVDLEIGISAEGVTAEDAIKALNVEVLTGSGPDVLNLDGLPIDRFIEQGQLYDLTEIYTEAQDSGLYYDNITGAFFRQGETRVIPLRYSFPLVIAERNTIANLDSLPSLVSLSQEMYESNPESRLFCNVSIMDEMFVATYPEIIVEGAIDKEALMRFFDCSEDLYKILKHNNRERCVLPSPSLEPFSENEHFDMTVRSSHYLHEDPSQILMNLVRAETDFALHEIYIQNSEADFIFDALSFNQYRCFTPSVCVAIGANSGEIELSKSFMRTLLSDEVQGVNHNEGLSVSKPVLRGLIGESFAASFSEDRSFVLESLQEETVASYQSLLACLDTPVVADKVIQAAVYEELQRCLEGEITKDEAFDNCFRRIELYLAE